MNNTYITLLFCQTQNQKLFLNQNKSINRIRSESFFTFKSQNLHAPAYADAHIKIL